MLDSSNRESHQRLEQSISQPLSKQKEKDLKQSALVDGMHIAKLFKWWCNARRKNRICHRVPVKLVTAKSLYDANSKLFDAFADIACKNSFDCEKYIRWCCIENGIDELHVKSCISSFMIEKYLMHVKEMQHLKDVYDWTTKSIRFIAEECISQGFFTVKDFLLDLISTNKIGAYVMAGKISMYWLAAIPNFDKVIDKLDYFSRSELKLLQDHFDIYHSDVNRAFLKFRNIAFNPIKTVEIAIDKLRAKSRKIQSSMSVCCVTAEMNNK